MNLKFTKVFVLIASLSIVMSIGVKASNNLNDINSSIIGVYSITETEEWGYLTKLERVKSLQFTDDSIERLSNSDLAFVTITYPFLIDVRLHSNFSDGFTNIYSSFSALHELERRGGLLDELIKLYNTFDSIRSKNSYDQFTYYMQNIEILVAQSFYQENADKDELMILDNLIIENIKESMLRNSETYETTLFKRALSESDIGIERIQFMDNYIESTSTCYFDVLGSCTYSTVTTPKGSTVQVIRFNNDFTSSQKLTLANQIATAYPNAVMQSNATPYYNCHSYAWYSPRTTNRFWMNNPSTYMTDGSYVKGGTVTSGMKIHYSIGDHSGIVTGVSGYGIGVISKWGYGGLYSHQYNDSPYETTGITFWK